MQTARTLNKLDLNEISNLLSKSSKLMKSQREENFNEKLLLFIENVLFAQGGEHNVVGYFKENRLIAMASAFTWSATSCWTLMNVHSDPGVGLKESKVALGSCLDFLLELQEAKGIYTFLFLCVIRGKLVYDPKNYSSLLVKFSNGLKRYNFYSEHVIAANTKPMLENYWNVMGKRTYPRDLLIRRAELREEFRTKVLAAMCTGSKRE